MSQKTSWNMWVNSIRSKTYNELKKELQTTMNSLTPIIEKELKMGVICYSLNNLAVAQNHFKKVISEYKANSTNEQFMIENEHGINILFGFKIVPDGCGGFDIIETGCGDVCGPFCCCLGVVGVMACCGINMNQITTCDTTDGQGCLDNCMAKCCCC